MNRIQEINKKKIKVRIFLKITTTDSILIFWGPIYVTEELKHSLHYLALWKGGVKNKQTNKNINNMFSCIFILFSILS